MIDCKLCSLYFKGFCKASLVSKEFKVFCQNNDKCCYRRKEYWKHLYLGKWNEI